MEGVKQDHEGFEQRPIPRRIRLRDSVGTVPRSSNHHFPDQDVIPCRKWGVEVVETPEIDRLESDWRRLTPESAAPFATFSWNRAWLRAYRDRYDRPAIFRITENGRTVAILPCYRKGKVFRLVGDNICDYQDILASDEESAGMAIVAVLLWADRHAKRSHFHFERLSSEGLLHSVLRRQERRSGFLFFWKSFAPCPYVDLRGGLENYLASLPRKMRGDLRRALNRLDREAPTARVVISRDYEIRASDLEDAAAFHVKFFRKKGSSPLADPRLVSLLGEVAKDPAVGLHLSCFTDQSETLAIDFGFARGRRYYGYLSGFNQDFRKLAPGKCLLLSRIDRWVSEDGVEVLDFLAGCEEYKKGFTGGECYRVESVRIMSPGLVHHCLRFLLEMNKSARTFAKAILRRGGYLPA